MDVTEYITGERLQELADHTIIFRSQDHFNLAMSQIPNTKCKYTIIENNEINDDIKNAKSIFIYTHGARMFFDKILPQLKNPITLISHNSDYHITEDYAKYLENNKLVKWYAQNAIYPHNKLIPIPIGIANSQWTHGNITLIDEIAGLCKQKENLVYKNFNINTSYENRYTIDLITTYNGIPMDQPTDFRTFLTKLSNSKFCICPYGAGVDSHRVWEALYMHTTPIVPDCYMFRTFDKLPIIYVKEWVHITPEYLHQEYEKMRLKTYNKEKLLISYWKKQIKGE